jgi:hypothetical protein
MIFEPQLLPESLRRLQGLIARYCESDDVVREQLLAQASDEQLTELRDAPAGLWDDINWFLDQWVASPPGPYQDAAVALDAFSQAAMEARLVLEHRAARRK